VGKVLLISGQTGSFHTFSSGLEWGNCWINQRKPPSAELGGFAFAKLCEDYHNKNRAVRPSSRCKTPLSAASCIQELTLPFADWVGKDPGIAGYLTNGLSPLGSFQSDLELVFSIIADGSWTLIDPSHAL
jgi:hypothetical protein